MVTPEQPIVWSRPLPPSPHRTRLIECFVEMCADESGDYFGSHALFVRKVLREDYRTAFVIAARFRSTPLGSVEDCEALADEWWEPTI